MENITEIANIDAIVKAIIDNNDEGFFFIPWIGKNYEDGLKVKKVKKGKKVLVVGASHYCNHSNICTHSEYNNVCSNFDKTVQCRLGCNHFQECTGGKTKDYDDYCPWMKKDVYSKNYEDLCQAIDTKTDDCKMIFEKLKSTTLGEVCNFLDTEWGDNNSFEKFSKFCIEYFLEDKCNKEKEYRNQLWSHIAFVNYAQNFQPKSTGNYFQPDDFSSFKKYIEILNELGLKPNVVIVWGCDLGGELEKKGFKVNAENNGYNWTKDEIQFVNSYHPSYSGFRDNGGLKNALNTAFQEASKVTNG